MEPSESAKRLFVLADKKYPEQKAFAAALGITPSIVSEWRRGKSESFTKEKNIKKICEVLGTTSEFILYGKESSPSTEVDELPKSWGLLTPEERRKAQEYVEMLIASRGKR